MAATGHIFVISAPSGAGKRTVLQPTMSADDNLVYAVSATTRAPRNGETEGQHYFFLDRDEFQRRVDAGEFVEWAEVHGNLYGTLKSELERLTATGKDVVLELDVQGMRSLRASGLEAVTVFITAPSLEELKRRIRARGTEEPDQIEVRMANAVDELAAQGEYDHIVVNDMIERAVTELREIIMEERRARA